MNWLLRLFKAPKKGRTVFVVYEGGWVNKSTLIRSETGQMLIQDHSCGYWHVNPDGTFITENNPRYGVQAPIRWFL